MKASSPTSAHTASAPASDEARRIPLAQLTAGAHAEVCARDMACEDCELLQAMGMTDRCRLRVCRAGRKFIVQVNRTRVGLSRDVADRITVEPCNA